MVLTSSIDLIDYLFASIRGSKSAMGTQFLTRFS